MLVQKKPVLVEAERYLGDENFNRIRQFVGPKTPLHQLGDQMLGIDTLEGVMRVTPGDWIIRGVEGEFYPCKPGIFDKTYEIVSV